MAKMTDEQWHHLYENFETMDLLSAVDQLDKVRGHLADGDFAEPPEIRTELLKLHGLAMNVVNEGQTSKAVELFESAEELSMQVFEMVEALEKVQAVLDKLSDLQPPNLYEEGEDGDEE